MSWSRYRRLLLVVAIPLLISGGIFTTFVSQSRFYESILCTPGLSGDVVCRATDGLDGQWDKKLRGEYDTWFDVDAVPYKQNKFPHAFISATSRLVTGVRIIEVSPYLGTDDGPGSPIDHLKALSGQNISIQFGTKNESERPLNPLRCNQLDFTDSRSFVAGLCGVPNGVARVAFAVTGDEQAKLLDLRSKIHSNISEYRRSLIFDYAIGTPLFFVLFLVISFFFWLVRRAISFVAAG